MALCIIGKWIGMMGGWAVFLAMRPTPYLLGAGLIGIAPIWLELWASSVRQVEPSRESRPLWRYLDSATDAIVFVLSPALWFWENATPLVWPLRAALVIFLTAGIFRLWRFLRRGLVNGKFQGLPVTYTGYVWVIAWWLCAHDLWIAVPPLLILLSFAMASRQTWLGPSR